MPFPERYIEEVQEGHGRAECQSRLQQHPLATEEICGMIGYDSDI